MPIFISTITPGQTVSWVRHNTHHTGIAVRVGVTHPVESYTLPPSTPFVEVRHGDTLVGREQARTRVVASELTHIGEEA